MSDKYIIKNCPAIYRSGTCGVKNQIKCQDRTDCVIKQIVELCKYAYLAEKHLIHKSSTFNLAKEILQKLDIQEVE